MAEAEYQPVVVQTVFDSMLLSEFITVSQHAAAHLFIESLDASGASVPSLDIASRIESPPNHNPSSAGDRHMIFSSAYRCMVGECNEDATRILMRICGNPISGWSDGEEKLKELSTVVSHNLSCLSKFYGVNLRPDPRAIVRRQVGG